MPKSKRNRRRNQVLPKTHHVPSSTIKGRSDYNEEEGKVIQNIVDYVTIHFQDLINNYLSVKNSFGRNIRNYSCEQINYSAYQSKLLSVSVVILTANYYESEILNLNIYKRTNCTILELNNGLQLLSGEKITHAYILQIDNYTLLHLHAPETGSNTPCGSADLVRYVNACEFLNPSCIISFGICFGTNMELNLGDTIIAEKIYPWSVGVKINHDGWDIKTDDYIINLRKKAQQLYARIEDACNSIEKACPGQKAILGNMITSEAVVSNALIKRQAIQSAKGWKILGGEMEGYGMAKEALFYGNIERTTCIILKAICDWGAVKNIDNYLENELINKTASIKDQLQAYAAFCAFRVLEELFEKKVFDNTDIISIFTKSVVCRFSSDKVFPIAAFEKYLNEWLENPKDAYSLAANNRDLISLVAKYKQLPHEKKEIFRNSLSSVTLRNEKVFYVDSQNMILLR